MSSERRSRYKSEPMMTARKPSGIEMRPGLRRSNAGFSKPTIEVRLRTRVVDGARMEAIVTAARPTDGELRSGTRRRRRPLLARQRRANQRTMDRTLLDVVFSRVVFSRVVSERVIERASIAHPAEPASRLYADTGTTTWRASETSDGSAIVYERGVEGAREIWVKHTRSGRQERLCHFREDLCHVAADLCHVASTPPGRPGLN